MLVKLAIVAAAVWAYSLWTIVGAYRSAPLMADEPDPRSPSYPVGDGSAGSASAGTRTGEGRSRREGQARAALPTLLGRRS